MLIAWVLAGLATLALAGGLAFANRNPARNLKAEIPKFLRTTGEIAERELFDALGGRTGAARAALRKLHRAGMIVVERNQRRNLVRVPGQPRKPTLRLSPGRLEVLEFILGDPEAAAAEIAQHLKMPKSTVYRHILAIRREASK